MASIISTTMESNTKGNGKMTSSMVEENKHGQVNSSIAPEKKDGTVFEG